LRTPEDRDVRNSAVQAVVVPVVTGFDCVLIANRGEIACRVIRTCRRLGIRSVAVYSDADRAARHVRLADEAVYLGGARPAESYLAIDRVLAAARRTGADAIHPGYGFLAENAAFAAQCAAAGVVFIGPAPETIRRMGSKSESKRLMEAAGVPVVPGYHAADQSPARLRAAAAEVGYPLMIKAVAGGGGKGMRIVRAEHEFAEALAGARREALNAFAEDAVLLERYVDEPRHIEFQVFGDVHGHVVHLFERECSIQRRYQKVIEETPSPFLDDALRDEMAQAAVAAARAVDYVNAGTIEFIVAGDRQFFFMEMNTRLQVEHPVTEMTTGLDLVEWQLAVAAGAPLPLEQDSIRRRGHAIEARIYAENPDRGFLPSTGLIEGFAHPPPGAGLRVDAAVESGDVVTADYDPMIAKLIVFAPTRAAAVARLAAALERTSAAGPVTNIALLRRIARDATFALGAIHTGYIDTHLEALLAPQAPPRMRLLAAIGHVLLEREQPLAPPSPSSMPTPWQRADAWEPVAGAGRRLAFETPARLELRVAGRNGHYCASVAGDAIGFAARRLPHGRLEVRADTVENFTITALGERLLVSDPSGASEFALVASYPVLRSVNDESAHPGSPLPGRVVSVHVAPGQRVAAGDPLVVIEGMKMEYTVRARQAGTIERVLVREGDQVEVEAPLIDIVPATT
jgi:3-methylcrotonyl-CoA carboxylase alpha subunit